MAVSRISLYLYCYSVCALTQTNSRRLMKKQMLVERIHVRKGTVTVVRGHGQNTVHEFGYYHVAIINAEILANLYNVPIEVF